MNHNDNDGLFNKSIQLNTYNNKNLIPNNENEFNHENENINENDELDIFRILIATDNHLGFNENDPIRGNDSFITFEEILKKANEIKVDFILLGGDLFHENKPSRTTLYRTICLLRKYCMGDDPIQFQIISDQSINFPNFGLVNYEDSNFNVGLPIFSIHGNHDDPIREGVESQSLAALDLLSASNLINYFGKIDTVDDINIYPILMIKGRTKLAIYGLGSIRDERLHRTFLNKKVTFHRPALHDSEWFNIFVIHQNRDNKGRGSKNCIPESFLPDFIHLVIWCHEHECDIEPQEALKSGFFVIQPGSSVATSLIEGEAKQKKIGIVEIKKKNFRFCSKKLQTVRPFIINDIVLNDFDSLSRDQFHPQITEKIHKILVDKVEQMLKDYIVNKNAAKDHLGVHKNDNTREVIVRLRVDHGGFPVISNNRFASQFIGKVANPKDILLFRRNKISKSDNPSTTNENISNLLKNGIRPNKPANDMNVENIVKIKLNQDPSKKLSLLLENNMSKALNNYIYKEINDVFPDTVNNNLNKIITKMKKNVANNDSYRDQDNNDSIMLMAGDLRQIIEQQTETEKAKISDDENLLKSFNGTQDKKNDVTPVSNNLKKRDTDDISGESESDAEIEKMHIKTKNRRLLSARKIGSEKVHHDNDENKKHRKSSHTKMKVDRKTNDNRKVTRQNVKLNRGRGNGWDSLNEENDDNFDNFEESSVKTSTMSKTNGKSRINKHIVSNFDDEDEISPEDNNNDPIFMNKVAGKKSSVVGSQMQSFLNCKNTANLSNNFRQNPTHSQTKRRLPLSMQMISSGNKSNEAEFSEDNNTQQLDEDENSLTNDRRYLWHK